ncbi:MAG: hypothetical protein M1459_01175 [Patescibacteria group bacterium]|nr:hypothetical protein [Patescibacteria group bacterium]
MQYTAEDIQSAFDRLTPEIQEVLVSPEINLKLEEIGKKHNLMIDQIGELVDECGLLMLGLTKSQDFTSNIISRCSIDRKTASEIVKDINDEVLVTIREHLMNMDDNSRSSATEESTPEKTTQEPTPRPMFQKAVDNNASNSIIREQHISALEKAGGFEIEREGHSPEADSWQKIEPMNVPETILEPEIPANLPVEEDTDMNRDISSVPAMTSDTPKAPSAPIAPPVNNNVEQKPTANALEEQTVDTPKRNTAKPSVFEPMVISPQSTTITGPEILATNTPVPEPELKESDLPKYQPQEPAEIQRPDIPTTQIRQEAIPTVPKPPVVSETPKKMPRPEVKNYDRDPYREPID